MSIFDVNMADILVDPTTAASGVEVMKQMETDIPVHPFVSLASFAISLKSISTSLVQINQTLHTGNLGQVSNLSKLHDITTKLLEIKIEVSNVSSGVFQGVNAKAKALEDELRRIRGY